VAALCRLLVLTERTIDVVGRSSVRGRRAKDHSGEEGDTVKRGLVLLEPFPERALRNGLGGKVLDCRGGGFALRLGDGDGFVVPVCVVRFAA